MHEAFLAGSKRRSIALLLVLVPHLLLGILLLRSTVSRDTPAFSSRLDIFFVRPLPAGPSDPLVQHNAAPVSNPAPRRRAITRAAEPPASLSASTELAAPAEEKVATQIIDTAALVGMAGKFDKELRKPGENLLSGAEGKSLRQKMDEAFQAAHLAVPLKWYEAARVELWSAENDLAKIYQVKTAFGTYCLFYADRLKNPDASPQPRISACPKRF